MTTLHSAQGTKVFPEINSALFITIILAGLAADLTWEVWARAITPFLVGGPLEPAGLVQSVFGLKSRVLAEIIHLIVGVVFYPIGYLFIARPLQRLIFPNLPLVLTGLGFGIGLWVFALYIMAHLIAGFPAFLGFIPLTWVSLIGHMLFGLIVALVVAWRENRAA